MTLCRIAPLMLLAFCAVAQNPSRSVLRLTVMIGGMNGIVPGAGVIFGEDTDNFYIVTAAHVVGPIGEAAVITVHPDLGDRGLHQCSVLASTAGGSDRNERPNPDLAVVACRREQLEKHNFFYDVLGDPSELNRGSPLTLIGNFSKGFDDTAALKSTRITGWDVPLGYFLLDAVHPDVIDYFNPLKLDLRGAYGGHLLTDRSEILGLTYVFEGPIETSVKALRWSFVETWIKDNTSAAGRLARVARSASTLRRNNVELAVTATSVLFPGFGWLSAAPNLRISAPLPNGSQLGVSFDFTFTQAEKNSEGLSVTIPSMLAQWQVGSTWGPLRRRDMLGGIYLAAGVAPVGLQRSFFDAGRQISSGRSWTGIFDVGWRYRFAGRSWGLCATYREGAQINASPNALYPRFRAFNFGTFVVFK